MGKPILFVENFLSPTQFPANTVTITEQATGHEGFRLADGRRSIFDYWSGVTQNLQQVVQVQLPSARTANFVAMDRGHNWAGQGLTVDHSDNGSTWTNDVTAAIPTSPSAPGTNPDGANGCVTEEGAWVKRFTGGAHAWWRFVFPAAVGLTPKVVGLWIGSDYEPGYFLTPWDEDVNQLQANETLSEWGWRGRGVQATYREGQFAFRLLTSGDYTNARYYLQNLYGGFRPGGNRPQPMWLCFDDANAERMFLALRPVRSSFSIGFETGWFPRTLRLPYQEHEPLRT